MQMAGSAEKPGVKVPWRILLMYGLYGLFMAAFAATVPGLYLSEGNCSVRPWRGVLSGGSREGGAQRLRVRLQCLASGQSQTSLVGLPYCLAVS